MDFMNVSGMVVLAAGGFTLGTLYGRRLAADVRALVEKLDGRVTAIEQETRGGGGGTSASSGAHAAALEKLAGAIEKHAAAIDDHGAATVAAAVESQAGVATKAAAA